MARIRPIAVTGHIDAPTFEKVLAACQKRKSYATVTVRNGMTVRCRVEVKGNVATIFFDLIDLGTNFSTEAEAHFVGKHKPYLRANTKKFMGAKSPFYSNFGKTSIHFHVLDTDASAWFDEIYQALLDLANFTEIETGFGTLDQKIRAMLKGEPSDEPNTPEVLERPPLNAPELEPLRKELLELQKPNRPKTPETITRIQKVYETCERPSSITRYVKKTRGSNCQLCGVEGFVMRNGGRYCEVHHLFHLSSDPPADCLGPEYLVVLCATCHRRMHYADVGEPTRVDGGWSVIVDGDEVVFSVADE